MELITLELIAALTRSGFVRNKSIIDFYLIVFAGTPWSISGLANATQMDQAIIRTYMRRGVEKGEFDKSDAGYELSEKGWRACMLRILHWHRHIQPEYRKFLYLFFKAHARTAPLREYLMFILTLDRSTRAVKLELSYLAAMKVIEWTAGPSGARINDIVSRTGFSYSVIHKQISSMVSDGYIRRKKGAYFLTDAGKRRSFGIFLRSWRSVASRDWIVVRRIMRVDPANFPRSPTCYLELNNGVVT